MCSCGKRRSRTATIQRTQTVQRTSMQALSEETMATSLEGAIIEGSGNDAKVWIKYTKDTKQNPVKMQLGNQQYLIIGNKPFLISLSTAKSFSHFNFNCIGGSLGNV